MNIKRDYKSFDFVLVVLVVALCLFGMVILQSAATGVGSTKFTRAAVSSQKLWLASGMVVMLLTAFIDYQYICKFYIPIYILNILLLLAVLVVGKKSTDVVRYISVGLFTILPSEFAKVFMIIWLAKVIDKYHERINNIFVLFAIIATIVIPIALIAKQPSLSASLTLAFLLIVTLLVGGMNYRYLIIAVAVMVPLALFFYYDLFRSPHLIIDKILTKYQLERVFTSLNPTSNPDNYFQTSRSILAISSGQLSGVGLHNNQIAVPKASNDFIFAIIGSEFGFIGSMAVIAVVFMIIIKCILIAGRTDILLGKLIASGVAAILAFHTFVNVGVASGLLPNTGITFPFISTGGSSMWISMSLIGLVVNVGMTKPKSMFED